MKQKNKLTSNNNISGQMNNINEILLNYLISQTKAQNVDFAGLLNIYNFAKSSKLPIDKSIIEAYSNFLSTITKAQQMQNLEILKIRQNRLNQLNNLEQVQLYLSSLNNTFNLNNLNMLNSLNYMNSGDLGCMNSVDFYTLQRNYLLSALSLDTVLKNTHYN